MRRILSILLIVAAAIALWWAFTMLAGLPRTWPLLIAAAVVVIAVLVAIRFFARPLFLGFFRLLNTFIAWFRLPSYIGALNLDAFRIVLRRDNLHDVPKRDDLGPPAWEPSVLAARTPDGSFNDLDEPDMGRAGMRFGRNFALDKVIRSDDIRLMEPNPREVSRRLMTRDVFKPAEILNMLAAAWIQFQVHGWVNHERIKDEYYEVPLQPDDPWPEKPMRIRRSLVSGKETKTTPASFANTESHWWDQSQIYGSSLEIQNNQRTFSDGKLKVERHPSLGELRLPAHPDPKFAGFDMTGFFDNYWIGLSMFHTVFALEHNAICDRLLAEYPEWDDQRLFNTARLVNCALMAKIHTVEWTPAILKHPTLQVSMDANWWGLFGERIKRALGRLSEAEEVSGIIGSPVDHHSASYSLTEEFTSVYRLHALIPDDYEFYSARNGELLKKATFTDIQGMYTRPFMDDLRLSDIIYSFGITHPGAVTLHNYPKTLQKFEGIDGFVIDLAAIDILRDRERGVPRYNAFRQLCHKRPVRSFEELTGNKEWAQEIRELYKGDIDAVDLMVGLYAEAPPPGFGFSDTAFRIFILMASRRLKSDRFFCQDYTANVYSQAGLDWVNENNMSSVFLRHAPDVGPALQEIPNTFAPWNSVTATRPL